MNKRNDVKVSYCKLWKIDEGNYLVIALWYIVDKKKCRVHFILIIFKINYYSYCILLMY